MKDYLKEGLSKKSGKAILVAFFVILVALSVAGSMYVFNGDKWYAENQLTAQYISGYGDDTFVFTLTHKKLNMSVGQLKDNKIEYDKPEALDNIKWTSSNEKVVHVNPDGTILALKKGKAKITATAGYYSSSCVVNVKKTKPGKKSFSTAHTANGLAVKKNKADKKGRHLYAIKVNRLKNCVTVYTYDENGNYNIAVRSMICSCGANNGTPTGTFSIASKNRWHMLYGNVYGQYTTEFNGPILFHSVPYVSMYRPNTVEVQEYNNLGKSVSMGCVRLSVSDAKWIYKNCSAGTKVTVYEDEKDGPLGTPPAMKINTGKNKGWDPADDDKRNPYYNKKPKISGLKNTTLDNGDYFDPLKGVTAVDTTGSDITKRIEVEGEVNTDKSGVYMIKYLVTDDMQREAVQYRKITIR